MAHPNFNTSVNLIQDEYILESNAYIINYHTKFNIDTIRKQMYFCNKISICNILN